MEVKENCGLFGVYGDDDAVVKVFYGLYALQHRGQESAGIATANGKTIKHYKGMGLVSEVFQKVILDKLKNPIAIGHVRYSTTGSSIIQNAQPIVVNYYEGELAIAHNGNLINSASLRKQLEYEGSIFQTTVDSEIILHLLARPEYGCSEEGLKKCMNTIKGAFSLLLMKPGELIAIRDPNGFRPLSLGKIGNAYVVASETCALNQIKAKFIRDIEPGEILFINSDGLRSVKFLPQPLFQQQHFESKPSFCIFEHVYFARPDSVIFSDCVHTVRVCLGRQLAKEHPAEADIVIAIPDSGNSAALGYSLESGIPFEFGFIRNHYVGRTFIQPTEKTRSAGVELKLNPIVNVIKGKRVIVVDDSIIRGTTSKARVKYLREAGAKEVHLRISCPPHKFPCFYGIDFPDKKELIASNLSIEEIRKFLDIDSIGYLSVEGMLRCVSNPPDKYCTACWTGNYPLPLKEDFNKFVLEKKK